MLRAQQHFAALRVNQPWLARLPWQLAKDVFDLLSGARIMLRSYRCSSH